MRNARDFKLQKLVLDVQWALERVHHYENECNLEEHTDVDELWEWVGILSKSANHLVEALDECS